MEALAIDDRVLAHVLYFVASLSIYTHAQTVGLVTGRSFLLPKRQGTRLDMTSHNKIAQTKRSTSEAYEAWFMFVITFSS